MDGGEEVARGLVVAGCDGTELLELGEEVLDEMACLVEVPVEVAGQFSVCFGRYDGTLASGREWGDDPLAGIESALLRAALLDQGWREGEAVTAISDGDPALPALVRSATAGPVEPIHDWFHLSMRVHHVEQVMRGLCALEPLPLVLTDHAQIDVERLRHLLWNGHHEKACETLGRIASWAKDAVVPNQPVAKATVRRLAARCAELRSYIENNEGALIDYGQRYRAGKPISTSRAEGTVNQLVSARMNKRRQMRWSPRGAHRVLQVRAAVLDERFRQQAIQLAA